MRQETGSNITTADNRISVRLPASGDFCVLEEVIQSLPESTKPVDRVGERLLQIELLTKRTMLIPTQMLSYEQSDGEAVVSKLIQDELSAAGIFCHDDERVVSLKGGDVTALVVLPKAFVEELDDRYGVESVAFEVPLLHHAVSDTRHLVVDSYLGVTTIKLFGEREHVGVDNLLFADVYETPTVASALYWVQRLQRAMELNSSTPLYIYRCSGTMRRLLLRNFKKIMICE